ncbi:hypothetical protein CR513_12341, partial [Mucuna pruriens]
MDILMTSKGSYSMLKELSSYHFDDWLYVPLKFQDDEELKLFGQNNHPMYASIPSLGQIWLISSHQESLSPDESSLPIDENDLGLTILIATTTKSKLSPTQINYTIIKKELLAIVFALDKFRGYLLGSKVIVFFDHAALKYLLKKLDAKLRLIRDKKGVNNIVVGHLSPIHGRVDSMPIRDDFPDEQLLQIAQGQPWFGNICNFLVASTFPPGASRAYKAKLESEVKYYVWDDPYFWRFFNDQITRRCILDAKFLSILHFYHFALGGGHYGATRTTWKVLDCGFYWPTIYRDAHEFVSACE